MEQVAAETFAHLVYQIASIAGVVVIVWLITRR